MNGDSGASADESRYCMGLAPVFFCPWLCGDSSGVVACLLCLAHSQWCSSSLSADVDERGAQTSVDASGFASGISVTFRLTIRHPNEGQALFDNSTRWPGRE